MSVFTIKLFGFEVFSITRNSQPRDGKGRFVSVRGASRKVVDAIPVNGAKYQPLTPEYCERLFSSKYGEAR